MFANNPQLQEQMRSMMPQMLNQLQNPEMQQMMSNPQVTVLITCRTMAKHDMFSFQYYHVSYKVQTRIN